jgi:hypothetical protein
MCLGTCLEITVAWLASCFIFMRSRLILNLETRHP